MKKETIHKWRAKYSECYYTVKVSDAGIYIESFLEYGNYFNNRHYDDHNYFRTLEDAQRVVNKIKKVFEKL